MPRIAYLSHRTPLHLRSGDNHKTFLCILHWTFLPVFLSISGLASAQPLWPPSDQISGLTLSLSGIKNGLEGDFNNRDTLSTSDELINLPDVQDGNGYEIGVGYRWYQNEFEFSYAQSKHDATVYSDMEQANVSSQARYKLFNFDYRYFFPLKPIEPLFLIGFVPYASVTTSNSSEDLITGAGGDATFKGAGFNLGGGLSYNIPYPNWALALELDAYYRWVSFDRASGVVGVEREIDNPVDGSAMNYRARISVIFRQRYY